MQFHFRFLRSIQTFQQSIYERCTPVTTLGDNKIKPQNSPESALFVRFIIAASSICQFLKFHPHESKVGWLPPQTAQNSRRWRWFPLQCYTIGRSTHTHTNTLFLVTFSSPACSRMRNFSRNFQTLRFAHSAHTHIHAVNENAANSSRAEANNDLPR